MSSLQTLHDAFAELEHRADVAELNRQVRTDGPIELPRPRGLRSMPVLAGVAAVAALVMAAVWVVPSDTAGPTVGTTVSATPPATYAELAERFRTALGDAATFEVTEKWSPQAISDGSRVPTGLSIAGPMTGNGTTGWFELVVFPDWPCSAGSCWKSEVTSHAGGPEEPHLVGYSIVDIHDDLVRVQLTVRNERDDDVKSGKPVPLDLAKATQVVKSDLWG